jgi:dihydroorotase-like cyclic amidohydrolase
MHFDMVVKNGEICVPSGRYMADIGIAGGKITAIANPGALSGDNVLDAKGKIVAPGFIHPHVHMREPGFEYKEDYESGTKCAAAGGFTMTIDMPNVQPTTTTVERYLDKKKIASGKAYVDFQHWPGPMDAQGVYDFVKVGGMPGMKVFMVEDPKATYPHMPELSIADHGKLYKIMKATAEVGLPILVHGEDPPLLRALAEPYLNDNNYKARTNALAHGDWFFPTRDVGTMSAIQIAQLAGVKLHILHIGQGRYMHRYLRRVKQEGWNFTGELESLWLVEKQKDPKIRKWLQLGNFRQECTYSEELWESVNDGTIDIILMEHAPHHRDEILKAEHEVWDAPAGIPTLQEMLPLLLNEVNRGRTSLERFIRCTSENPARLAGLYPRKGAIQVGSDADLSIIDMKAKRTFRNERKGAIQVGSDADLSIIDMKAKRTFRNEDVLSNTEYTPWVGYTVTGVPVCTIVRGNVVMEDGKIVGKKGYGEYIPSMHKTTLP